MARKKVTESEGNAVAYARYATRKQVELPQEDAAIYARYSSHMQNDASIEQQVEECREYARTHNLRIVEVYADRALSGRNDKRPEFQKMLRHAEAGNLTVLPAICSMRSPMRINLRRWACAWYMRKKNLVTTPLDASPCAP